MKDIDEMFKDILEDKDEDYTFSNFTFFHLFNRDFK